MNAHSEPRKLSSVEINNLKNVINISFNETRWTSAYKILCDLDSNFFKNLISSRLSTRSKALDLIDSITEGEINESSRLSLPEYILKGSRENESILIKLSTDENLNLKELKIDVLEFFEINNGNIKDPSFETRSRIKETITCYDQII